MQQSIDEKIKHEILNDIKEQLKGAWNNARVVEVENELETFTKIYEIEKQNEIERKKASLLSIKEERCKNAISLYNESIKQRESDPDKTGIKNIYYKNNTYNDIHHSFQEDKKAKELRRIDDIYEQDIFNVNSAAETNFQNKREYKRQELVKKYESIFLCKWNSEYLKKFEDQFVEFNKIKLDSRLLARHEWLKDELVNKNRETLVNKFSKEVIKKSFWMCLKKNNSNIHGWSNFDLQNATNKLEWTVIDDTWLTQFIQSYPLREPNNFLDHFFFSLFSSGDLMSNALTRYDLFNLSIFQGHFVPQLCFGEVYCIKTLPIHIDELYTFSREELDRIEFLFVNINTELTPKWVLLHKKNGLNALYLSEHVNFSQKNLESLSKIFPSITIVNVDLTKHFELNEEGASRLAIWHAALITRVFFWCQKSEINKPSLADYRNSLPALILIEKALHSIKSGGGVSSQINNAFANRLPYSEYNLNEYFANRDLNLRDTNKHLLEDWKVLPDNIDANLIIDQFDNNFLNISKSKLALEFPDTLTINTQRTSVFLAAIKLLEHHKLSRLVISNSSMESNSILNLKISWRYNLVTTNFTVTTIIPSNNDNANLVSHKYLYVCAARNRFIKVMNNCYLKNLTPELQLLGRKKLWNETSKLILDLFKNYKFNFYDIHDVINFNRNWRLTHCANEYKIVDGREIVNDKIWSFVQLAQMGCHGLDVFFERLQENYVKSWNKTYKEYAPDLNCVFDLNGSIVESPDVYINSLTDRIKLFGGQETCAPLFKSLALICPEPGKNNKNYNKEIQGLILALHQRRKKYPDEICEVVLYNFDISNPQSANLLELLQKDAENKDIRLQISITIPDWDRESFVNNKDLGLLKAKYKNLQNYVENNLRFARYADLKANTQAIFDYKDGKIDPEVEIGNRDAQRSQIWHGEDIYYPITAESPGIQQQLQQQISRESNFEQAKKHETVKQKEVTRQVSQYFGSTRELITRYNIEERCRNYWDNLPEETRKISGISSGENLSKFFSLIVGSDHNSSFVIEQIHPLAMEKIMNFAPYFKDGIDYERTPGFDVKYLENGRYVLTFDDYKEKQDLMMQKKLIDSNKRDAFARKLKTPKAADVVRGDYRQFSTFVKNSGQYANPKESAQQILQTHWAYLANEEFNAPEVNSNFERAAISLVGDSQKTHDERRAILALYNATESKKTPLDLYHHIDAIKNWVLEDNPNISRIFLIDLFKDFTQKHTKALGQIFNQFDLNDKNYEYYTQLSINPSSKTNKEQKCVENVISGTNRWFQLAAEVHAVFGEDNFIIWKKRLLTPREDWSEILDKEEVNALIAAIITLKDNNDYQNILWSLVDTHGNAVGPMRLSEVWYGFAKLLKFVEKNCLTINNKAFFNHLANKMRDGKFNATNFLYRLYFVLNHVAEKSDSSLVQQEILDNIDIIDWRFNGLYYACRYGKYNYAHDILGLTELISFIDGEVSDIYEAPWDDNVRLNKITNLCGYALRYVAQRMALHKEDYNKLVEKIRANSSIFQNKDPSSAGAMRLLLVSFAVGIDSINELGFKEFASINKLKQLQKDDIVNKINSLFLLDSQDLKKGAFQMRIVDLPIFIEAFKQCGNLDLDLDLINICGHALYCFEKQGKDDNSKTALLSKLLRFVLSKKSSGFLSYIFPTEKSHYSHPLIALYPWIIDEVSETNGRFNFVEPFSEVEASEQINIFKKQLSSINPKNTTWFPNYQEIRKAIIDISKSENNQTRKNTVKKWKEKGCCITDENANYRRLSQYEEENVKQHRDLRLSVTYASRNKILFQELVRYLAVRLDIKNDNIDLQVKPLLDLFSKLDGKMEYDELSKILGLLLDKIRLYKDKYNLTPYYSIEQLTSWLLTFFDETEFSKKPYPTKFLEELLNDAVADPYSSLLNANLEYLRSSDETSLRLKVLMTIIINAGLSFNSQVLLVQLAVNLKRDRNVETYIEKIKLALTNINSDEREKYFSILVTEASKNKSLCTDINDLIKLTEKPKFANNNQILVKLFKDNQAKLLEMLAKKNIRLNFQGLPDKNHVQNYINDNLCEKDYYINLIIVAALEIPRHDDFENIIHTRLNNWRPQELVNLAIYYTEYPRPTIRQLANLLTYTYTAKQVIHNFETVVQAEDQEEPGTNKRVYSVLAKDVDDIKRVLNGFKLKGFGFIKDNEQKDLLNLLYYTNSYSKIENLSNLQFEDLKQKLYEELNISRQEANPQYVGRVLACMREILLRKTGKWANHTQMIDLLYGALHNNESLLHQVKTGEGKSIITLMRTSYRALNGQIVDIFSSKDSLSQRDHAEFKIVFNAFGIRNSYINPSSSYHLYHNDLDNRNIGAVNYCTVGNWSLFISGVFWQNLKNFDLKAKNRVAFIDEGDHVLLDDHTQFNYSDNGNGKTVYNYDEWVYREAYEFYLEHRENFKGYLEGNPSVSRNNEIKNLCERLQRIEQHVAPKQSKFFREFIIPAIQQPNSESFEARDQQLRQLFSAAHVASGLIENKHYCIMPEARIVSEGVGIDTNFAKVMINNQLYDGSTYSDLVQQFLHVRLNYEAVQNLQTPKFFVEPETEIALSFNAPYIIKNYYAFAEACTGTSGDKNDLDIYFKEFNIHCVIKLPTHAEVKTEFLAPIYATTNRPSDIFQNSEKAEKYLFEGRKTQAENIVKSILENNAQPILITCEDDISAHTLGKIIKSMLKDRALIDNLVTQIKSEWKSKPNNESTSEKPNPEKNLDAYVENLFNPEKGLDTSLEDTHGKKNAKFILDTNDSRLSEAYILPFTGRKGSITISSRMGRGTDIKPYDKKIGLRVIRTYPTCPRVAKQEQGRQGRNGANGACQDILNYNEIYFEYLKYIDINSPYLRDFKDCYKSENEHLEKKIEKHKSLNSQNKKIWAHISNNFKDKEKYLITRTLQRLKLDINKKSNKFIHRKDELQSILCGEIISALPKLSEEDRENFRLEWRKTRRKINSAWNRRLANKQCGDTEEVYKEFFISIYQIWQGFAGQYYVLNPYLLVHMLDKYGYEVEDKIGHEANVIQITNIKNKWLDRSHDDCLIYADIEDIKKDLTTIRKMTRNYHSDKLNSSHLENLGINEEQAKAYFLEIVSLRDNLLELIRDLSNLDPTQTRVRPQTNSLNNNSYDNSCLVNNKHQQLGDMAAVISFYQTWFEGVNKYIVDLKDPELDRKIYDELFGKNADKVDLLFDTLDFASKHNTELYHSDIGAEQNINGEYKSDTSENVSIQEQTYRRNKLFKTLTKLFQDYSSCYVISAENWAKIIRSITQTADKNIIANYPEWLDTFFKALGDKSPINLKSEKESVKIGRIFRMMFEIYGTVYIHKFGEIEVSKNFTEDILEILLNRYTSDLCEKFIDKIEKLFTKDKGVGELLLLNSNKADIVRMIDVLEEHKESVTLNDNFTKFIDHATKNIKYLESNPACIRSIFEFCVYVKQEDVYVPSLESLSKLIFEQKSETNLSKSNDYLKEQAVFLNFLSQRPGHSADSYNNLIKLITNKNINNTIASLAKLPPYISVDFIVHHLSPVPGKYDIGQYDSQINCIKNVSKSFNDFLYNRGIIASVDNFNNPLKQDSYAKWTEYLGKFSLSKNQSFFSITKEVFVTCDKLMLQIASDYSVGIIADDSSLRDVVALLKAAQDVSYLQENLYDIYKKLNKDSKVTVKADLINYAKLVKSIPSEYQDLFKNQLTHISKANIEQYQYLRDATYFAKVFSEKRFTGFNLTDLTSLNDFWISSKFDTVRLKKHIEIAESLVKYETRTNEEITFRREYIKNINDESTLNKLCQGLKIFNEVNNIPTNSINKLLIDMYLLGKKITPEKLQQVLNIYQSLTADKYQGTCLLTNFLDEKKSDFSSEIQANKFFAQERLDQFSTFMDVISKESLPSEVINNLFHHFLGKSLEDINNAIKIFKLALNINQDRSLFNRYFSSLDNGLEERISLMRFVHHGVLDFLGTEFKNSCIKQHQYLFDSFTADMPKDVKSDRVSFKAKLYKWCLNISKIMYETLEIMRSKSIGSAAVYKNQKNINIFNKSQELKIAYRSYAEYYKSFWFSKNTTRTTQASKFFNNLQNINSNAISCNEYYLKTLSEIHRAQQEIVADDIEINSKRWITNINGKGYSRLFDITTEIKSKVLQSYHSLVLSGNISPDEYKLVQAELKKQIKINYEYLVLALPKKNKLRDSLLNCESIEEGNLIAALKQITTLNESSAPKHLRHLVENLITNLQLTDTNSLWTASFHSQGRQVISQCFSAPA